METCLQDIRFAMRSYRKTPGFTIVALVTLALGIGANSAIFTVVNAVVLRPLPFPEPDRLVRVTADVPGLGATDIGMSAPELFDYRDRAELFESIAGLYPVNANLTQVDQPERVEVLLVSPSYFSVLGVRPALGRLFGAEDDHPGIAEVAVISDALWTRRFGGAPDVLGRTLRIDDDSYAIVGVLPPGFRHPGRSLRGDVELWAPAGYRSDPFPSPSRGAYFLSGGIARLKPGLSVAEAQHRLNAFGQKLRGEFPADYPVKASWTPRLVPLQEDLVGNVRPALFVMLVAVGLVLAIACANIAGLLLARATVRQRELAVRRALGSGRLRIVRLLLTESVLLAAAGGALGLVLAIWGVDLLLATVPSGVPRTDEVHLSGSAIAFACAASVVTGILFGLAPAIQFSSPNVVASLKEGEARGASARRGLRPALVAAEFALAMVLLVGATLLVRSFWRLQHVDTGFDGRNVLTARLWLPRPNDPARGKYLSHPPRLALFEDVLRRARELPGVESAAIVQNLPLDGQRGASTITIEGRDPFEAGQIPTVHFNFASHEYFRVMNIPVVAGRTFNAEDGSGGAPVAVISEEMARRYFPDGGALGHRVRFGGRGSTAPWMTIVGVVGDVPNEQLELRPRPMLYRPMTQATNLSLALVVRSGAEPARLAGELSQVVRAADPDLPTFAVRTMEEVEAAATAPRRFSMQLLGGFALLALLLAAIGIYGMTAYLVSQRTREIGIRVALGASPVSVMRLIMGYALGLAGVGVLVGIVAAGAVTPLMKGMLFEVSPIDPATYGTITASLVATALVAALMPARRAARVDPMIALRMD
jgi:putative ABC transport system permease protein